MALEVARIPVLSDNYVWLLHDPESGETAVIDPAVAEPVLAEAGRRHWQITQIWNTHWHQDHAGGNAEIVAKTGAKVVGPQEVDRLGPAPDRVLVREPAQVQVLEWAP